ncbi:hypothetical protein [Martelella alba]|uniref:hypothetical protein n=1 Tax=Martelella alba TaxID=2590451 RepID=UPI0015E8569F|nr:hypothetical protein [Martelella alba]
MVDSVGASSPPTIEQAALWLTEHRHDLSGPVIPALKQRFGLRNLEAIAATKRAHEIEFGEGNERR